MKTLKIGIASYEEMKARTLAIARGDYKPRPDDPKVWFTSPESFAKVLSAKNRALLNVIAEATPRSLTELAEISGRQKSNLSRTLKTMQNYGLVTLKKGRGGRIIAEVPYQEIALVMPVGQKAMERSEAA